MTFAVVFVATAFFSFMSDAASKTAPNIVLIVADDMGQGDVSCYWGRDLSTPHIDSIASNGIRFVQGYVTAPICGPSRAGLLTGRYQQRFGFETIPTPEFKAWDLHLGMPVDVPMIQEVLKKAGYRTGMVGKWHLGVRPESHPNTRGFDYFFGFLGGMHDYFPEGDHWWNFGNDIQEQGRKVTDYKYLTDEFTDRCIMFIKQSIDSDAPFFLYAAYNAPHGPEEAPDCYIQRNLQVEDPRRRVFAGMISALDDGVGRILDMLDAEGVMDETMIVFLTDNGTHRKMKSPVDPFKGAKGRFEEGGVRVPFLIQWASQLPKGKDFLNPVFSLDLFQTFVCAANIPERDVPENDGVNLVPYLTGENFGFPHETLCWRMFANGGILHGKWKLLREKGEWTALYNLETDWREQHNLLASYPEVVKELRQRYQKWDQDMVESIIPLPKKEDYQEQRRLWQNSIRYEILPPSERY